MMETRSPLKEIRVNTQREEISSEQKANYNSYIHKAKSDVEKENLHSAWKYYKKAYSIVPTEKVATKISKLEVHMTSYNLWPESQDKVSISETADTSNSEKHREAQASSHDNTAGGDVTDDVRTSFNNLIHKAKSHLQKDEVYQAYLCYQEAQELHPSEKMERKVAKMKIYLKDNDLLPVDVNGQHGNTDVETAAEDSELNTNETDSAQKQPKAPETETGQSEGVPNADTVELFRSYAKEAKELLHSGKFFDALDLYRMAYKLFPGEAVQKRITKIENHIKANNLQREATETKVFEEEENLHSENRKTEEEENHMDVEPPKPDSESPQKEVIESVVEPAPLSALKAKPARSRRRISSSSDTDEDKFREFYQKAKEYMESENYNGALAYYKKAQALIPSDKLQRRITKLQEHIAEVEKEEAETSQDEPTDDMMHLGNGFYLFKDMFNSLYSHQRQGILWMWGLYNKKKGGILGDDMGLGKTIQVIGFLSGMFDAEKIKAVLIVLPVAVMMNWEREFNKWAPGLRIDSFHGPSKSSREKVMQKVSRKGGVILTSYGMLQRPQNTEQLSAVNGREFVWDYVILDEGHKIKNPSNKCSKGVHMIPARNRLILTGTPIQNNLKEMWTLFDWTLQGSLLGTAKTFSMQFSQPIMRARQKDATAGEHRLGQEMANSLKNLIQPFFMRRTKAEVSKSEKLRHREEENEGESASKSNGHTPHMPTMTRKNDLICWVYLSDTQQKIYEEFLSQDDVKELLNTSRSPLTALNQLKKICDHPRLMTTKQCLALGLHMDEGIQRMETLDDDISKESAAARINHIPDHILVDESGKMTFLVQLLDNLKSEGHRCLIFSQSRKMLDIIQKVMRARGHKIARLDGTMRHLCEREDIINKFSRDRSYSLFLLTTQVGGVGLTLTAADRVVIFDPSWNPATDAQAVDRAFRIGQDKNVVIYRLITCGSVEEKIYRRQIFKDSITKQTTGDSNNPYRYFSRQELHELFVLDNPKQSSTQVQLNSLHDGQRKTDTSLDEHIAFLHTLDMFGLSDHDLMFNKEAVHHSDEDHDEGNDYIQNRVDQANRLIALEAEENLQQTQQTGKYAAPEVFAEKMPRNIGPGPFTGATKSPNSSPEVIHVDHNESEDSLNKTMGDMSIAGKRTPRSPTPPDSSDDDMDSVDSHDNTAQPHHASPQAPRPVSLDGAGIHGNAGLAGTMNVQHLSEEDQIKMVMEMSMIEARENEKKILEQIQKFNDEKTVPSSELPDVIEQAGHDGFGNSLGDHVNLQLGTSVPVQNELNAETGNHSGYQDRSGMEADAENIPSDQHSINKSVIDESSDSFKSAGDRSIDQLGERGGRDHEDEFDSGNVPVTDKFDHVVNEDVVNVNMTDVRPNQMDMNENEADMDENEADVNENEADVDENEADVNKNGADVDENKADVDENEADVEENDADVDHGAQVSFESLGTNGDGATVQNDEKSAHAEEIGSNHSHRDIETADGRSATDEDVEDKGAQVSFSDSNSDNDIGQSFIKKQKRVDSAYKNISSESETETNFQNESENFESDTDLPSLHVGKGRNQKKNVINSDSESDLGEADDLGSEVKATKVFVEDSDESMELGGDAEKQHTTHTNFTSSDESLNEESKMVEGQSNVGVDDGANRSTLQNQSHCEKLDKVREKAVSSPMKAASSGINKRALTPRDTPISNKKRRSVNMGLTPRLHLLATGGGDMAPAPPAIIQEELVFSPRANEPEVAISRAPEAWSLADADGELEYKAFEEHVQSSSNVADSTRMYDTVAKRIFPGSSNNEKTEMTTEVQNSYLEERESSDEESEEEQLSAEELAQYKHYVVESRKQYRSGDLKQAMILLKEALKIYADDEAVIKYAMKLQKKASEASQK